MLSGIAQQELNGADVGCAPIIMVHDNGSHFLYCAVGSVVMPDCSVTNPFGVYLGNFDEKPKTGFCIAVVSAFARLGPSCSKVVSSMVQISGSTAS